MLCVLILSLMELDIVLRNCKHSFCSSDIVVVVLFVFTLFFAINQNIRTISHQLLKHISSLKYFDFIELVHRNRILCNHAWISCLHFVIYKTFWRCFWIVSYHEIRYCIINYDNMKYICICVTWYSWLWYVLR